MAQQPPREERWTGPPVEHRCRARRTPTRRLFGMANEHDHDTVVVDEGGGSSMGMILGIIGIVVLLVAVWYFALGPGAGPSTTTNENNNTINPPAQSLPAVPGGSAAP